MPSYKEHAITVTSRSAIILILVSILGFSGIASVSASTWDGTHPRRAEVNHRLDGKITARQAHNFIATIAW